MVPVGKPVMIEVFPEGDVAVQHLIASIVGEEKAHGIELFEHLGELAFTIIFFAIVGEQDVFHQLLFCGIAAFSFPGGVGEVV